jgi:hypothetical protein
MRKCGCSKELQSIKVYRKIRDTVNFDTIREKEADGVERAHKERMNNHSKEKAIY